ncbi:hypothetical protein [Nocardia sp. NBC_01388]|uniref:hypothetical protein n=1 Tax=Nocardia sp. NBC_01388 TaxID=2903596 RepID=UPI0032444B29
MCPAIEVNPATQITNTGGERIGAQTVVVRIAQCMAFRSTTLILADADDEVEIEGVVSADGRVVTVLDVPLNLNANESAVVAAELRVDDDAGNAVSPVVTFEVGVPSFATAEFEYILHIRGVAEIGPSGVALGIAWCGSSCRLS